MERQQELKDQTAIELSFFTSLTNLSNLYEFTVPDVRNKVYPYNILFAYQHVSKNLEQVKPGLKSTILQDHLRKACLSTIKIYDTRTTLYYIPIEPLYNLLKQKDAKAWLLLSVFAYFLQTAKVPYYWQSSSFLANCYDVITDWVINEQGEWDKTELKEMKKELKLQDKAGNSMLKMISKPIHLLQFSKRIKDFTPDNNIDRQVKQIAERTLALMISYPDRTFDDNIIPDLIEPEEEERVIPEHYVSFIWQNSGWIYDQLIEYVNSMLQEYSSIDEPLSLQLFDLPQKAETHDLSFEELFFPLIDDLVTCLNHIT